MKQCPKCGRNRRNSSFYKNAARKDGLTLWCKDCNVKYASEWRVRNREKCSASNLRCRQRNREIVYAAKDIPCADCGQRYPPYVMDFDHTGDNKEFNVSARYIATSRLLAEIAKCEVVCANCHRERTWVRLHPETQGTQADMVFTSTQECVSTERK